MFVKPSSEYNNLQLSYFVQLNYKVTFDSFYNLCQSVYIDV